MSRHRKWLALCLAMLPAAAIAAEPAQVANRLFDHLQAGQIADAEAMLAAGVRWRIVSANSQSLRT